jgi:hypothetical protein
MKALNGMLFSEYRDEERKEMLAQATSRSYR